MAIGKGLSDAEFKKKYGITRAQAEAARSKTRKTEGYKLKRAQLANQKTGRGQVTGTGAGKPKSSNPPPPPSSAAKKPKPKPKQRVEKDKPASKSKSVAGSGGPRRSATGRGGPSVAGSGGPRRGGPRRKAAVKEPNRTADTSRLFADKPKSAAKPPKHANYKGDLKIAVKNKKMTASEAQKVHAWRQRNK